jgi:HAE1 family hydrophobic/amphiphilic exporter-1
LGTILLSGIVVNNAIIIIDFYIAYRDKYETRQEALVMVGRLRFTPILITTMTTLLGMLPIALALGDSTNIVQPLGIAVCGGLVVSTFLTLLLLPAILNLLPEKMIIKSYKN